ncbi:GntR family transcriptional regulator [Clostridium baratii]|uniref:GntR family transcriptional regulator n=1 Tax=Clostridium baratii TaxID=1561 RepID=UPI0005F2DEB6|nr:GntR family transcriptional regulator [Clostridium baratii]AQM59169.1 GntR family transcriptional regulator [Clostridium baratii]KJU72697.1 GntR family transcriptional regulator [Clostridium baratii]MBS6041650.1 GntR family transcriptional regulator [Clostridium baratii]MDY3206727.1 GntR family transcriptional regulator [Clostridium baratii]
MLKYEEIACDIQKKIESGYYRPNDQLPFEKDMCKEYGVSRITIKKAMDSLVMKGLVAKRRGAGTFVKDIESDEVSNISTSNQFEGFSKTFSGMDIVSKIIEFKVIIPDYDIAQKLKITDEDFVYYIVRARYANEIPYVVEYTYMPINIIPGVKKETLKGSLYEYIEETLNLKIKSAHRTIRATLPNEIEQEYLNISENFPILEVEQIAFLDNGQPFEYSKSRHRSDKFEFKSISIK